MNISGFFDWDVAGELELDGRPARSFSTETLGLGSASTSFLARFGGAIFGHQKAALEHALEGRNVCLATGTSSGKSLVFQVAALELLERDPSARVLAIYSMKALGREQEERWRQALTTAGLTAQVGRIDGSIRLKERPRILRDSRIVIMTPDVMHAWFMTAVADRTVQSFLEHLRLVVVDEIHTYTGVFGSHAAFLFRRLQHLLIFFRARPQYIAASGTLAAADRLLAALFGLDFEVIDASQDTSQRHDVHIQLVRPPGSSDFLSEIAALLSALARSGDRRFIAFVDSRKQTEHLAAILAREQPDQEGEVSQDHLERLDVLPYRAGYEERDREVIQRRLSAGHLPGVISTSALELGIDIPALDTAVLIGVPRNSTSLHQRIGRIGRHGPGHVVVISAGDLYDEAILARPHELLDRPHVEPALYLENRRIQYIHALCLARSGGEHDQAVTVAGGRDGRFRTVVSWPEGFVELCEAERLGELPPDLESMKAEAGESPNHTFPLRDVERQFQIELRQGPDREALGSVSYSQLLREAYPGAVYYYTTRPFRVHTVKLSSREIRVRPEKAFTTKPIALPTSVYPKLAPDAIFEGVLHGDLHAIESEVQIRQSLCGFKERRGPNEFASQYPLDAEQTGVYWNEQFFGRTFFATAVTLTHPSLLIGGAAVGTAADLLYEAFLMSVPVERRDVGVAVDRHRTARGPIPVDAPFLALFDQVYGSLRISGKVLENGALRAILTRGIQLAEEDDLLEDAEGGASILEAMLRDLDEPAASPWWDVAALASGDSYGLVEPGAVPVILPGSSGLDLLHGNREYHVERVFFSPVTQRLSYSGFNDRTRYGVKEILPVEAIAPLEGVSAMGEYDLATGELRTPEADH